MNTGSQRFLLYLEGIVLVVLLVFLVRTVIVVRFSSQDPLAAVTVRHANNLVRRVNPEAGSEATQITTLATRYALTRDTRAWLDLATAAWRMRETREVLSSRIQKAVLDERLTEDEKRSRVSQIVTGKSIVAVMPGSTQGILSALSSSGINPVQVRREDGLLKFEGFKLVVVGRNAMSGTYKDYYQALGPVLTEYVENGGRILILPQAGIDWAYQWLPGLVVPSAQPLDKHTELGSVDHLVLKSVAISDLPLEHSDSKQSAIYPLSSVGPQWTVHVAAYVNGSAGPILAEIQHGSGRVVLCQLALDAHYGHNQAASKLLDNLVTYMLEDGL